MNNSIFNKLTISFCWKVFCRRILWLVLAAVIGGGFVFVKATWFTTPVYSTFAQFGVELQGASEASGGSANTQYMTGLNQVAINYAKKVDGNVFYEEASKAYNVSRYCPEGKTLTSFEMDSLVYTTSGDGSATFTIIANGEDPKEIYRVIQFLQEYIPIELNKASGVDGGTTKAVTVKAINYGKYPDEPENGSATSDIIVYAFGAAVAVYAIFFLLAFFDKKIYEEDALKAIDAKPLLGKIPAWQTDGAKEPQTARCYEGRVLNAATPENMAESFRNLRTGLTYVLSECSAPVFGVVSDLSGTGRSLVAANTALSFAQQGKKVLLIDGDMRCPAQQMIFGLKSEIGGLYEALAEKGNSAPDAFVQKDVQDGLDLMVCGNVGPDFCELLSSDRMKKLLEKLKAVYDYIFIDLPPVLENSDAAALSAMISGYAVVVRAGYSRTDSVCDTVEKLSATKANIVGFVLNGVAQEKGKYDKYGRRFASVTAADSEQNS